MASLTTQQRFAGGIWGLLVGDALGVPYEFTPPQRMPLPEKIDFNPPRDFLRAHWDIRPGTWSDDGAQALCVLASLLERKSMEPHDLMDRIVRWYRDGYMAVNRDVYDVGLQTSHAIGKFLKGVPARDCGRLDEQGNGNGSLMRVLPLALWHQGSERELVLDALVQSRITHGHLRACLCCAQYCLWARGILRNLPAPWLWGVEVLESIFPLGTMERQELDEQLLLREEFPFKGTSYVVDTLHSAHRCMEAGSYEAVVRAAVGLGHDTDTTGCVAGGIAGLRDGVDAIPKRWMKALRGKELAEPLLQELLLRQASQEKDSEA